MEQKSTQPKTNDDTGGPSLLGKRHRLDHDFESDTEQAPTPWPRYLVIKPNNKENNFSTISPFAINKALLGISGEMKTVRKLSNGDLMVETTKRPHSENLLKCNNFINFPVTVTPHRSLNSSRGIIRHREFKFCSDEEVQENLSSKGVTDVKRISVTRDGTKQPTNTFILTFNVSTPPPSIKIAWFNVTVEPYIPNPLRCFNCQRFGHHKDKCKCKLVCARCGGEGHEADGCTKTIQCFNCKGEHFASAKSCPKWISEKEIQTVKHTKNISYPEARKIVEQRTPSGLSYADAARPVGSKSFTSSSTPTKSFTSTSVQTDFSTMYWGEYKPSPQLQFEQLRLSKDPTGSLRSQPGPSKAHTGSSTDHGPSGDHTGPSRDHTGSSKNHLGSPQNQSQAGSSQNQSQAGSVRNQSGSKKSQKSQKHSTGSQPISKENKSTSKDNKSPQIEFTSTASTDPCTGGGKTNSKSITKKSKTEKSKLPTAPKSKQLKKLTSNRFDPLSMDTSEPISPACIPPRPTLQLNPVLPP